MIIGCPTEIIDGEKRVALTPSSAIQIQKLGYSCPMWVIAMSLKR